MKKILLFLIIIPIVTLNAQTVTIPDANFLNALVNVNVADLDGNGSYESVVDTNGDGFIQVTEAEAVIGLRTTGRSISSLEGIASFINLEVLEVWSNNLTELDLSSNTLLTYIDCSINDLTTVNVTQCPNLTYLGVDGNEINQLDVTNNTNLIELVCQGNNFTSIDLSQNTALEILYCFNSQLETLDVSNNLSIKWIYCHYNQIEVLDISQNLLLERLYCQGNLITSLDLSANPELFVLSCLDNQLTYLNINNGNNMGIQNLNTTSNPNLLCIQVDDVSYANSLTCDNPFPLWCKDATAEYSEDCGNLSTEDVSGDAIKLYPNPVEDKLFIENLTETIEVSSITIYNLQGSEVLGTTNVANAITVSNLSPGLYFCSLYTSKGVFTYKILKR